MWYQKCGPDDLSKFINFLTGELTMLDLFCRRSRLYHKWKQVLGEVGTIEQPQTSKSREYGQPETLDLEHIHVTCSDGPPTRETDAPQFPSIHSDAPSLITPTHVGELGIPSRKSHIGSGSSIRTEILETDFVCSEEVSTREAP